MGSHTAKDFQALSMALLTVSDTRGLAEDTSGATLAERIEESGHKLNAREIVTDDLYSLRAVVATWIADKSIDAVIINGGTGITQRDVTPEAISPLFDRCIEGFGELFRHISFTEIGPATLQSRALAGIANATLIFAVPGSPGACCTAWDKILAHQLDARSKPCNFANLLPRIRVA
ncbi:molybdenum cofactor biosynthesis protein B [Halorhodospira halochloris]|uniref:molybdenum cofactor biosynthesis protein B n=1 Tax=Halorhodospira halochloris TaxID=1052 RepID=UPI001EE9619C|nr:molybdenum cofactor biosynthesis protein B [Halorhodospira halochloris]MCG5547466.1 molybdenum cofactor biosynthesis protein B [Halorhodospira halochloris]